MLGGWSERLSEEALLKQRPKGWEGTESGKARKKPLLLVGRNNVPKAMAWQSFGVPKNFKDTCMAETWSGKEEGLR